MASPVIGNRPRFAPRPGATVDRSHPLAQGLEFCFVPGVSMVNDLARSYPTTFGYAQVGNPSLDTSGIGTSVRTLKNSVSFSCPDNELLNGITVMWAGTVETASDASGLVHKARYSRNNSSNQPFVFYLNFGRLSFQRGNAGSSSAVDSTNLSMAPAGFVGVLVAAVATGATTCDFWANNTYSGSGNTLPSSATSNSYPISVGADNFSTTGNSLLTSAAAVWGRRLSNAEIRSVIGDPFCFLRY